MNTYLNNKLNIVHEVESYHEVIEKTNFVKCQKVSNSYGMFYGNSHLKDCFVLDCHFPRLQYSSSYSVTKLFPRAVKMTSWAQKNRLIGSEVGNKHFCFH